MRIGGPGGEVLHRGDLNPLHRHPHHPARLLHLHRAVLPQIPQHRPFRIHLPPQQSGAHVGLDNGQNAPLLRPVHQEVDHRNMALLTCGGGERDTPTTAVMAG
jgi:hypothetical protein